MAAQLAASIVGKRFMVILQSVCGARPHVAVFEHTLCHERKLQNVSLLPDLKR